ncbi:MAG: terminase large subunit [Oscillospiraceae bacterium]|nr:terminase large subunit [Oscillospiraceae bacterium]
MKLSDCEAVKYAENVLSGKQIACVKIRQACQRFIHDLENQNKSAYKWRFDPELGAKPARFIERFCRPTKGERNFMKLMPWQHFVENNVYGWIDKETGLRRFREALIVVGRGNGKSTLIAGNACYLASKDGERGADIYLLANAKSQARIILEECKGQISTSPALAKHFRCLRDGIYFDAALSKIETRASDSTNLDGLNPHGVIFDEIHKFRDYKLINVMKRSIKKRRQPLFWYITTLGDVLDGPLMDMYTDVLDLFSGTMPQDVADRFFPLVYEIDLEDDVEDIGCWIKANPALGEFLSIDETVNDWKNARLTPQKRSDFINKQLNVFTDIGDMPYVDIEIIDRNSKNICIELLRGRTCYGGLDASLREDFTAASLVFPLDGGEFFVLQHSWVPSRKVGMDNEKIPYREWQEAGYLTIIPGEIIEQETIFSWFKKMRELYHIKSIGCDMNNAVWLIQFLKNDGFDCQEVRQGWKTLNDPMKDLKELLLKGKIIHNNDKMLRWYLSNVKLRKQQGDLDHENWVPTKRGRFRKIDGFMAWLDAHTEYMRKNPIAPLEREPNIEFYCLDF